MNYFKALFLLLLLVPSQLCAQQVSIDTVWVEPYRQLSYGAFFKSLSLKTSNPAIDHIGGFDFEWGSNYHLVVNVKRLAQPPADGSSYEVTFLKLLSQNKAADTVRFAMWLESDLYLGPGEQQSTFRDLGNNEFRYFDAVTIEVPDHLLPDFTKVVAGEIDRNGVFTFGPRPGMLVLQGWE